MRLAHFGIAIILAACIASCGGGAPPRDKEGSTGANPQEFTRVPDFKADATDDSLPRFVAWLDALTPLEYEYLDPRASKAAGQLTAAWSAAGRELPTAARKAFPLARQPHTRLQLLWMTADEPLRGEAWDFVARVAADRKQDPKVRYAALSQLAKDRTEATRTFLRTFLGDADPMVRKVAAFEVTRFGKASWAEVAAFTRSTDMAVRWGTAMALALWDPQAIQDGDPFPLGDPEVTHEGVIKTDKEKFIALLLQWVAVETSHQVIQHLPKAVRMFCGASKWDSRYESNRNYTLMHWFMKALGNPKTDSTRAYHLFWELFELAEAGEGLDERNRKLIWENTLSFYIHHDKKEGITLLPEFSYLPYSAAPGAFGVLGDARWAKHVSPELLVDSYKRLADGTAKPAGATKEYMDLSRLEAAHILATQGDRRAVPWLKDELRRGAPHPHATWFSYLLYELDPSDESEQFLRKIATDPSALPSTRVGALTGFAMAARGRAEKEIVEAMSDSHPEIRWIAARLLGYAGYYLIKEKEVYPILARALGKESDPGVAAELRHAIAWLKTSDPDPAKRKEYADMFFKMVGLRWKD